MSVDAVAGGPAEVDADQSCSGTQRARHTSGKPSQAAIRSSCRSIQYSDQRAVPRLFPMGVRLCRRRRDRGLPLGRRGAPRSWWFLSRMYARRVSRDFRLAGPRWHLYTPESRRAHEILFGAQSCSSRGRHLSPRRRSTDWRPCFQGISQTPLHTGALSSPRGLRCTRPRVSLPALAAPRSSSACRRRAAGSDALLPAAASSTGHASRAGPRSSPAAAGDS